MKRLEVLNLPQVFENLKNVKGIAFAYALMKNKKIIETEKDNLNGSLITAVDYREFIDKVRDIIIKNCVTESNVITLKDLKLKEDSQLELFEIKKQITELQEEYTGAIAARQLAVKEYQEFLKEEAEITLYRIKEDNLPTEGTLQDLIMLAEMIDFETLPAEDVEFSNYQILTYVNLFNRLIGISDPKSLSVVVRDKCLINFIYFKQAHKELYKNKNITDWLVYEELRKTLAQNHAETDVFGDPLIEKSNNGQDDHFIITRQEEFDKALSALNAEYSEVLKNFYDFLAEKTTVKLCKINQDELPDTFSLEDLQSFESFLKA